MKEAKPVVVDSPPYKTQRGLLIAEIDELDAAHKIISRHEDHILDLLRERGYPDRAVGDVLNVLADLVSEPVV